MTIDEPYVLEHQRTYTAAVPLPYEVTTTEEHVIYELEDYTVDRQVPYIVEDTVTVVEVQQEAYLVEKRSTPSYVTHDVSEETVSDHEEEAQVTYTEPVTYSEPAT